MICPLPVCAAYPLFSSVGSRIPDQFGIVNIVSLGLMTSQVNDTRRVGVPVRTARTFWYEPGALSLPLRKRCDETNRTLEGLSTWKVTRTWAPLPPPEGHERDGVIQPDAIHPGYIPDGDDGAAESSGGEVPSSG